LVTCSVAVAVCSAPLVTNWVSTTFLTFAI
jgi:hypothetical protein